MYMSKLTPGVPRFTNLFGKIAYQMTCLRQTFMPGNVGKVLFESLTKWKLGAVPDGHWAVGRPCVWSTKVGVYLKRMWTDLINYAAVLYSNTRPSPLGGRICFSNMWPVLLVLLLANQFKSLKWTAQVTALHRTFGSDWAWGSDNAPSWIWCIRYWANRSPKQLHIAL